MLPLQNWSFSFLLRSHIKAQIAAKGLNPNLKGFKLKNLQTQISLHSHKIELETTFRRNRRLQIFICVLTLLGTFVMNLVFYRFF